MGETVVESHFDKIAQGYDNFKDKNSFYYDNLKKLLSTLIPKNKVVFEVGCGTGDLVASLDPKTGYGMDISGKMVVIAKTKFKLRKELVFSTTWPKKNFDYVFMSDVIEHLEEPEKTFQNISKLMGKDTIFVNTMANPLWEPILMVAEKLKLKMPEGPHKRITSVDLIKLIENSGMKVTKHGYKLLIPIKLPLLTKLANNYLEKPFRKLAFIEYLVAVRS